MRVVDYAKRFRGIRYVYGGSSPRSGFDCSGFVRYVYAHFGVSLPHSSYAQFGDGRRVARRSLRPGDLIFFDGGTRGQPFELPISLLAPGGVLIKDDLTPGEPIAGDPVREAFFEDQRLIAVELLTTAATAAIVAVRRP